MSDSSVKESILNKAREFRRSLEKDGGHPSYFDYNRFKSELIRNGVYGAEGELAEILRL